tara:strand:+ start:928 stop:1398 length:471 start_codon:yes stop_codon:yes gene_type:complete
MIIESRDGFGKYLDEFNVGDIYRHWPGKTVTESDNHTFCLLTMNDNPLHTDENYMQSHQHGKILVVGTLVFSLVVGMSVKDTSGKAIANLEYESIKHDAPVFQGDTIYAESEILDLRDSKSKSDRGIVYIETRAFNQNKQKVLTLRRKFLAPKNDS